VDDEGEEFPLNIIKEIASKKRKMRDPIITPNTIIFLSILFMFT